MSHTVYKQQSIRPETRNRVPEPSGQVRKWMDGQLVSDKYDQRGQDQGPDDRGVSQTWAQDSRTQAKNWEGQAFADFHNKTQQVGKGSLENIIIRLQVAACVLEVRKEQRIPKPPRTQWRTVQAWGPGNVAVSGTSAHLGRGGCNFSGHHGTSMGHRDKGRDTQGHCVKCPRRRGIGGRWMRYRHD